MFIFKENTDNIKDPLKLKYMKLIAMVLSTIGVWPHKDVGQKENNIIIQKKEFILSIDSVSFVLMFLYIKNNLKRISFFELGNTYITIFMNVVGWHRVTLPFLSSYKELTQDFVKKFHLLHYRTKSEYSEKVHQKVHKICTFFTVFIHCQMCIGFVLFNMTPVYNNYRSGMYSSEKPVNGTLEHSIYYFLPFDYQRDTKGYIGVFLFNWYLTYVASCTFCYIDLYVCTMVFHMWGHFKILEYNLNNFPRPKNEKKNDKYNQGWYDPEESEAMTKLLTDCIDYHKTIIDFMTRCLNTFGLMLAMYLMFHQVSGCILLLLCSKLEPVALVRYGPLTLILFQQLIQISIVFELIGSKSETLKDFAYEIPWECMNVKNRRIVLTFLCNVQNNIEVKVMGMVAVGVRTMDAILRTSVSYFVILRTFATD